MKKMKIALISMILIVIGCQLNDVSAPAAAPTVVPECVQELIDTSDSLESVYSYLYQSDTVYLFNFSDVRSEVHNADCSNICFPAGGISPPNNTRCDDFFDTATKLEQIY